MLEEKIIKIIENIIDPQRDYLGDDAAIIDNAIYSTDSLIENIHFNRSTITPFQLGYKAVAVNMSDIAAMGGFPKFIMISLSLPQDIEENFIKNLYEGITNICETFHTKVIGGNVSASEKINIAVSIIGELFQPEKIAKRSNVQPGNFIVTTGEFGASAAGLKLLSSGYKDDQNPCIQHHLMPLPEIDLAAKYIEATTHTKPALIDTSDGLADGLLRLALASNITIELDLDKVKILEQTKRVANSFSIPAHNFALYGGEDYRLLGSVSEQDCDKLLSSDENFYIIGSAHQIASSDHKPSVKINASQETIIIDEHNINSLKFFNHFLELSSSGTS